MADKRYLENDEIFMKEWNHEKNVGLDPKSLTTWSKIKVWWKCSKGHEWEASVVNRNRGRMSTLPL